MTEPNTPSKSSKIVHWIALVLLFLMMAQPTVDNIRAMMNGAYVMGDITVEVTLAQMSLHIIAMLVGWVGLVWFFQKKKRGAYTSIIAHALGFVAASTQTPQMLEAMPPAAIAVFFVILFAITLGPIFAYKEEYA